MARFKLLNEPSGMTHLGSTFTAAEARAAGLQPYQLSGPRYQRLFRGGYARAGSDVTDIDRLALAMRMLPSARFVSHQSAAAILGGVVPESSDVHVGTFQRRKATSPGLRLHFFANEPELIRFRGLPMTSAAQTFLNLARPLELVDLLVLGDSLVHQQRVTPDELRRFCAERSTDGVGRAREAAALVRVGVESPNESRLRLLLVSAKLPEPIVNFPIIDARGREKRRIDLTYPEFKLAIEYDGRRHIDRENRWRADVARREELEGAGWRFVIVTAADLFGDPAGVIRRIVTALRQAGCRVAEPDLSWRRHFAA